MKKLLILLFLATPVYGKFFPKSFTASFEQIYKSTLTKKEKRSWGELSYKFPSNIRFEVKRPKKVLFISNRKKSWVYRPPFMEGEKGEASENNTDNTGLAGLLDSLHMGLVDNKIYKVKKEKNKVFLSFNLKSEKRFGVKESELLFKSEKHVFTNLLELKVIYPDGKKVTFKLSNIFEGIKFKTGYFKFVPPKNTNLSN
ncbi:MAG: outer membrane lipoprotein carrier protein LolA [Deltaproteobacteria bacterium]|nr:MAG: outer membrane lipoprotein carrier protein LolA [Deltaproteobacteria bacterium]